jgi:hypothetical protein
VKFFVPGVEHPEEAERFYTILKTLATAKAGPVSARRIYSISYSRGRQAHSATVSGEDTASGLPCVAIFEGARGGIYFIYTEGRISGSGHMAASPYHVEVFDDEGAVR